MNTTKPRQPEEKFIFTEGIFPNRKTSIWGTGDKDTLELLKKSELATNG